MEVSGEKVALMRNLTACVLLNAAFFALPLAFLRLGGEKVPFFGLVEAVTLPVAGAITAAAVLLFADWKIYRHNMRWQLLGAAQCALLGIACRHGSFQGIMTTVFYVTAPLAGAALHRELKRFLPFSAALWAVILLISGFASENFTGFTGNWNWTQALLFALLPGVILLLEVPRRKTFSALLLAMTAFLLRSRFPAQFSRVILPATAVTAVILFCVQRMGQTRKRWIFTGAFLISALAFFSVVAFADWHDSRFQLWKGAADLALFNSMTGVGVGNFAAAVLPYIPEKYFFTAFAAPWHSHPHNELLNFLCAYGIAGGFFIFALAFAVLTAPAATDRRTLFARWIFLLLLICGMFDMPCAATAGAMWCFLCAGIGTGDEVPPVHWAWRRSIPATVLTGLALYMVKENIVSTTNLRRGELALYQRDAAAARQYLRRSSAPLAQYRLAELELMVSGDPQYVLTVYPGDAPVFMHSHRLRALALLQTGQTQAALEAMKKECRNYPFSIINARLFYLMRKNSGAPEYAVAHAHEYFLKLCRLRNISPAASGGISPEADDRPLPRR